MTAQWRDGLVGGEPAGDVITALVGLELTPVDGMVEIGGRIELAAVRALMRLEAELLLADADQLSEGNQVDRDHGQRRADAFELLLRRVKKTLDDHRQAAT